MRRVGADSATWSSRPSVLVGGQRFARQHRLLNGRDPATRSGARRPAPDRRPTAEARLPARPRAAESPASARRAARWRSASPTRAADRPPAASDTICQKLIATLEQHDRDDDRRVGALAERGGNRARDQENDDERIREQVAAAARAPRIGGWATARSARTPRAGPPPRRSSAQLVRPSPSYSSAGASRTVHASATITQP